MPTKGILSPLSLAFLISLSAITGALLLEHVWGYQPCILCLEQRLPYYIAVPLIGFALILKKVQSNHATAAALLLILISIVLFAWGLDMSGFHAGAEWGLWAGPEACGSAAELPNSLDAYIAQLKATPVIDCTKPALIFLGLSLAGWSFVALTIAILLLTLSAKRIADKILSDLKG
jgi:disulfide bond formation protein DsbB